MINELIKLVLSTHFDRIADSTYLFENDDAGINMILIRDVCIIVEVKDDMFRVSYYYNDESLICDSTSFKTLPECIERIKYIVPTL